MLIELDIFSGRPNPRWPLSPPAARKLAELHRTLPPSAHEPPDLPGLGYRGFVYELDGNIWRAWNGYVIGSHRALTDYAKVVETLLLSHLPPGHAGLRSRISGDV